MSKVEKEYFLKSKSIAGKLYALLAQTPEIYMEITAQIVEYANEVLGKTLDENIFLNLIDHISFAVNRMEQGLTFKNTLLWEIVHFYPEEYRIAQYGLELIQKHTGYRLPEDEAGSIAMHIVNAEFDSADSNDAVRMTELIHKIVSVVRYQYHTNFDEDSVHFVRFITHLKFFATRLFRDKMLDGDDPEFHGLIREKYPESYECAEKIGRLVWQDYQIAIPEEELIYLTVYIKRITMAEGKEAE
jgi:beta-glucoside operon transcriptional antiterminator